ncbi:AFG2-interacting ribosome maturation factor isoform X2 [Oryctolagus cuniculus]|uniref:AFG2-interacting ribosome maturation factor isoform X2 n=1 Tax=Oryctolagus cuniculus TaxID=9986 RepID=UPI002230ABBC|nr:ribosome biogenesis protein C1orf109 homolog isoform X2 [Oryctolagus cuniculus]
MTADRPLLAVREALRRCFPAVEEQQGLWQGALRDCQPLVAALSNLAEQMQASQSVRFEDVPALRAFPDLQERLRRKQLEAGDAVLDKLGERLATLLKVRDTVSSQVERVFQVYEQHADTLGLDAVLQPSAASPSVADMLEWLQDMDRHYRNSFRKVPEEKGPPLLHPVGRLGQHPSFAPGLGPNSRSGTPRVRARYAVECFVLPGRVRKLCVSLEKGVEARHQGLRLTLLRPAASWEMPAMRPHLAAGPRPGAEVWVCGALGLLRAAHS